MKKLVFISKEKLENMEDKKLAELVNKLETPSLRLKNAAIRSQWKRVKRLLTNETCETENERIIFADEEFYYSELERIADYQKREDWKYGHSSMFDDDDYFGDIDYITEGQMKNGASFS